MITWLRSLLHGDSDETPIVPLVDDRPPPTQAPLNDAQLRIHAHLLAQAHVVRHGSAAEKLPAWLNAHERTLDQAFDAARMAAQTEERSIEPAAEWLIDNYYVIKEQIKEVRTGLPRSYLRQLPLAGGDDGSLQPRILVLMRELALHLDSHVRIRMVRSFVAAYQEVAPLTLGELWATPLMLRFALIERLTPLSQRIVRRLQDTESAAAWAGRVVDATSSASAPAAVVRLIAEIGDTHPSLSNAWIAEFQRRIQGRHPTLAIAAMWVEQEISAQQADLAQMLDDESRAQAAGQVSISNAIESLRLIGRSDWGEWVESVSTVDAALSDDPAGVYRQMNFNTRDRYRHAVEMLARRGNMAEWDVAARVVEWSRAAAVEEPSSPREQHVGYWLVGDGRRQVEIELEAHPPMRQRFVDLIRRYPSPFYVIPIVVLTLAVALLSFPVLEGYSLVHATLMLVALVIAASHFSVAVVNWLVTQTLPPATLCRLALRDGIPDSLRTLVVVPCLLSNVDDVQELVAGLEIRFLANRDRNFYYVLLTDFLDSPERSKDNDEQLLEVARRGIEGLNQVHEGTIIPRFCLIHRDRQWNARAGLWMGRERKRGKLEDLNRVLRKQRVNDFHVLIGDLPVLQRAKYVIVLDADTQLPPQSAHALVATMAHPLNQPCIDRRRQRVVAGYGVLQPRISVGASRDTASALARLFSDEIGLDPYTRAVSDVYHDMFGEASFVGKGIYDIDVFLWAACRRFPSNLILSHDLLEGCHARTGLVSDVELFEHHPDAYSADVHRRHRWTRGDWQIFWWLLPWVPGPRGRVVRNALSSHHRWKIFDNLRRSVVPGAMLVLLLSAWLLSPRPLYWTGVVLLVIFASPLLISLQHFLKRNPRMDWMLHMRLNLEAAQRRIQQTTLLLVMLPFEGWQNLDAIARAIWRMLTRSGKLLEWVTDGSTRRTGSQSVAGFYRLMWPAPIFALATAAALAFHAPRALYIAGPLLLIWLVSPWIAAVISRPGVAGREVQLSAAQRQLLGADARRTWHFFEVTVGAADHWLPPDNYQDFPDAQLARRTSPTNIGMYLLSALSAFDLGYIAIRDLRERVADTLDSMDQLQRYRGHFLNWYRTDDLQPLSPAYVSTVDSGNLIGALIVLARGLVLLEEEHVLPPQAWRGLRDAWQNFHLELDSTVAAQSVPEVTKVGDLADSGLIRILDDSLAQPHESGGSLASQAQTLAVLHAQLDALVQRFDPAGNSPDAARWLQLTAMQCQHWLDHLARYAPWLYVPQQLQPSPDSTAGRLLALLDRNPSLRRVDVLVRGILADEVGLTEPWGEVLGRLIDTFLVDHQQLTSLAQRCRDFTDIDFSFLWIERQRLLTIGYNIDENRRDAGAYDLLASEARLISFITIAQGKLPREHWFALGRLLTSAVGHAALVSWSGSMFEYLMPQLVMPAFENTLLARSCRAAVDRQIEYGRERGVPWGISECAYNLTDAHLVYQYRAFGVPGLGLKRGLADDLVIAPYATMLAAMLRVEAACRNLQALRAHGAHGPLGYYESLDFTPARVPPDADYVVVRTYMAHHQGMGLLALSAMLNDRPLQRRFMREPMFRANQLLLQEKVPAFLSVDASTLHAAEPVSRPREAGTVARVFTQMDTSVPQLQLLSNGRYHVVVSQTGGGASRWNGLAVSGNARIDGVRDDSGTFCYVQDLDSGALWSNTLQPTRVAATDMSATFSQASAEFRRRDHGIETRTRMAVSFEDDIELRRVTLVNRSGSRRRLALTSFVQPVMSPAGDARAHPTFNKLFIQTEYVAEHETLLARRRARSAEEDPPYFLHLIGVRGAPWSATSYESRRLQFIGRGRSVASPRALEGRQALENHVGSVLDPVAALRREVVLEPGESVTADIVVGVARTREDALQVSARYSDQHLDVRVFELAWTRDQVVRQQLGLRAADTRLIARLASSVLHPDPAMRRGGHAPGAPAAGQSQLWKHGISGDLPIVLVRIGDMKQMLLVNQVVRAHVYWRNHGLRSDLVILNEDPSGYRQELHDQVMGLVGTSAHASVIDQPGGVFVRRSDQLSSEDRTLLMACARVVLDGDRGTLAEQLPGLAAAPAMAPLRPVARPAAGGGPTLAPPEQHLDNGIGTFSADGREYIIWLQPGHATPMPWANVLANAQFGTVISESGGAYSWHENAHEYRLTSWYNDPVTDDSGEALYIRDDDSGHYWSPTPLPVAGIGGYRVRHGFGYSHFEYLQEGIFSRLTVHVARDQPLKYNTLLIRNDSTRQRTLTISAFVEWVLAEHRQKSAPHIRTWIDTSGRAVYARNAFNDVFGKNVAFFSVSASAASATADRAEYIGRNRSLRAPAAMAAIALSGRSGSGLDPCAAFHVPLKLAPGEQRELVFVLGSTGDEAQARHLALAHATASVAAADLLSVHEFWQRLLGRLMVQTPDEATNLMANGWLTYQIISSRLWARSGYYQSGGAYGFRDQLQDVVALLAIEPDFAREQIIRAAGRQFAAGDVQHWWHPPTGRGVRTHISDDYLWLPWVTTRYLETTGDTCVLDVKVPFLDGRPLSAHEESWYDLAEPAGEAFSIYEHCARAIRHADRHGSHGLPLMGGGDWNDGMNLVGAQGRGESVWMAFFIIDVLQRFAPLAAQRGDDELHQHCVAEIARLRDCLHENGWDGDWYRRAYMDDGQPLGSAQSVDCQLDSLPQSWATLAQVGPQERRTSALDHALERLVHDDYRVIQLFDPPFDAGPLEPGYIKGYVPGTRENGGQYTHAALWLTMACAQAGRTDTAWRLLELLNPVNQGLDAQRVERYMLEPYVVAADVYWAGQHRGRGGWSWYTGSASWMHQVMVEALLGFQLRGDRLQLRPCVPDGWQQYRIDYRYGDTEYQIDVRRIGPGNAVDAIDLDGQRLQEADVPLVDDGTPHMVIVHLGTPAAAAGALAIRPDSD